MITISFDEQGKFEDHTDKTTSLIAGFLFDDKDIAGEKERELKRIECYLKKICSNAKESFPGAFHYDPVARRGRSVKVQKDFGSTLAEFLEKGTYNRNDLCAEKRQGEYHAFAYIKSKNGKEDFLQSGTSDSTRDTMYSNLYIHMVNDVIYRMIFDNPCIERIDRVSFDLPSRVYVGNLTVEQKKKFASQGFHLDKTQSRIYVTGTETYRASIEREIFHSGRKDLKIEDLSVRSISYQTAAEEETLQSGFLYMSDLLCSVIGDNCSTERIGSIPTKMNTICGKKNMVFYYDSIDTCYSNASSAVNSKDYIRALNLVFDGMRQAADCAEHYKKKWFPLLLEKMKREVNISDFAKCVEALGDISKTSNLEQDRLLFICKQLEKMKDGLAFSDEEEKRILYDYYNTSATAYNHLARTKEAKKALNRARKYLPFVTLENRLDVANREAVAYCDELNFPMAKDIAERSKKAWDAVVEIRQELFGEKIMGMGARKAYSQLGQVYAFAGDDRAEDAFLRSIGETNDPNAMISLSYLLHYYAETGDHDKFERYAKQYFGGKENIREWLHYLIAEGTKGRNALLSMKFALYVYVKGLYLFYMDVLKTEPDLCSELMEIGKTVSEYGFDGRAQMNGHPWEIIYKYLALVARELGEDKKAKNFMHRAETAFDFEPEGLLKAIILYGKLEYTESAKKRKANEVKDLSAQCWEEIMQFSSSVRRRYHALQKRTRDDLGALMTYMYH
ncbi:MAG: hypothetical protein IJ600_02420 [Lachnospiraceae bacterium]|nr:hypothetical protein [Lachnospiraceae bacterium]